MAETVYLTQRIKDILINMVFGHKEKIALFLGDRVSNNEIYVTNVWGPAEGEVTSASLNSLLRMDYVVGAILNANKGYIDRHGVYKYVIFTSHSHPRMPGEKVWRGDEAWSVDDVPPQYESQRGNVIAIEDKGSKLIYFSLKDKSDGKGGDDLFIKMTADRWRASEYQLFARPAPHLVEQPMTREVAIDCYKYDPEMSLGKIRKIEIADRVLTEQDLKRTLLDPNKLAVIQEEGTGNLVLPYRKIA